MSSLSTLFEELLNTGSDKVSYGTSFHSKQASDEESMSAGWCADLKHGVIYFEDDYSCAQDEPAAETYEDNILVDIKSNGYVGIRAGDGDGYWFESVINNSTELHDLLHFYEHAKINNSKNRQLKGVQLNLLIESVHLLLWDKLSARSYPYNASQLKKTAPEAFQVVNQYFEHGEEKVFNVLFESDDDEHGYSRFYSPSSVIEQSSSRETIFSECVDIEAHDIIIDRRGRVILGLELTFGEVSTINWDMPTLILKPNANYSSAWLYDYFKYSEEAQEVISKLLKGWQYLPKGLKNISIETYASKDLQIVDTTERRLARHHYAESIRRSLHLREPFHAMQSLYKNRAAIAESLHTELLDDMVALKSPLPFFLEYPYHGFRKEDDPVRKVKAAQRLLGVMIKVPLFLMLEELTSQGSEHSSDILDKLRSRPQSDGTLLDFLKATVKKHGQSDLNLFKPLALALGSLKDFDGLVTARNRMHHEPYDEEGFLTIMNETVPTIISQLRAPLSLLSFIIPTGMKIKEEKKIISFEDISNSDGCFRKLDLEINLPLENFPTEKLIVYRNQSGQEASLVLSQLFTSKTVMQQSRDFGLFDRVHKNESQFTFLRSE